MRIAAIIITAIVLASPTVRAEPTPSSDEGQADMASVLPPQWDRQNLTEERSKVAAFVDGLLGSERQPSQVNTGADSHPEAMPENGTEK